MTCLAIFDIDDTLIQSRNGWRGVFRASLEEVLGHGCVGASGYAAFRHVTGQGVTREACQRHLGREVTQAELRAVCDGQLRRLMALQAPPPEVPGAVELLGTLDDMPGWCVAIGSGNFAEVSSFKLRALGVDPHRYPQASSDDSISRVGVIEAAIARARETTTRDFERIVYVGDGSWDVQATRELAMPMLGIAADGDTRPLERAGVSHVLTEYTDANRVIRALCDARVPL